MNYQGWRKVSILVVALLMFILMISFASAESQPSLSLKESTVILIKGKSVKLVPILENVENPKKVKYSWTSSDIKVATVNNGMVRAISGGNAEVTCTAILEDQSTISTSAAVTVIVQSTSVKLISRVDSYRIGKEYFITAEILPSETTNKVLQWSVKDPNVASVDKDGKLTFKQPGKTTITATTTDGSKRSASLSVYAPSLKAGTYDVYVNNKKGNNYSLPFYGSSNYWLRNIQIQKKGDHAHYATKVSTETNEVVFSFTPVYGGDDSIVIVDNSDRQSKATINVHVMDTAIAKRNGVIITDVKMQQKRNGLSFNIQVKNLLQQNVEEVYLVVGYFTPSGSQRYCYSYDNKYDMSEYLYTYYANLPQGKTGNFSYTNYVFTSQEPIGSIIATVYGYKLKNGNEVIIPDSQLRWFSSETGYERQTASGEDYASPDSSIMNKSDSFLIGYSYHRLFSKIKGFVKTEYPGELIVSINEDSIAQKAGLLAGDVIYGIDDMVWSDEPCMGNIAKAKMYDGETVTVHVIRNGMKKDLRMAKNMDALAEQTDTPLFDNEETNKKAETSAENSLLEITSVDTEQLESGAQQLHITCKNVIDSLIHDTTLTICIQDDKGVVVDTLNASLEAVLRPGKSVTFDIQLDGSIKPAAVYIDQITYTDIDGNQKKIFVNEPVEYVLK